MNQTDSTILPQQPVKPVWLHADHDKRIIYLNPTLYSSGIVQITSSGISFIDQPSGLLQVYPTAYKPSLPTGPYLLPADEMNDIWVYFETFFVSQLWANANDRMFLAAWLLSAPLVEWLDQPIHIRLVGNNKHASEWVKYKLQILLFGNATEPSKRLSPDWQTSMSLIFDTIGIGAFSSSTWVARKRLWINTVTQRCDEICSDPNIVKITCNQALMDRRGRNVTDDSIHMFRARFLSAQYLLLSEILKQHESELADNNRTSIPSIHRLTTKNGLLSHKAVIRYITNKIETAIITYRNTKLQ